MKSQDEWAGTAPSLRTIFESLNCRMISRLWWPRKNSQWDTLGLCLASIVRISCAVFPSAFSRSIGQFGKRKIVSANSTERKLPPLRDMPTTGPILTFALQRQSCAHVSDGRSRSSRISQAERQTRAALLQLCGSRQPLSIAHRPGGYFVILQYCTLYTTAGTCF